MPQERVLGSPQKSAKIFSGPEFPVASLWQNFPRALFEQDLFGKFGDRQLAADIGPLLAAGYELEMESVVQAVSSRLVARCRANCGSGWKPANNDFAHDGVGLNRWRVIFSRILFNFPYNSTGDRFLAGA